MAQHNGILPGMDLLSELRKAMREDGRSRRQIALAAGLDPTALWRLDKGHGTFFVTNAEALAKVLGLEIVVRTKGKAKRARS